MIVITIDIKRYTMTSQWCRKYTHYSCHPSTLDQVTCSVFILLFISSSLELMLPCSYIIYKLFTKIIMSDNILLVTYALSLSNKEQSDHIVKQ